MTGIDAFSLPAPAKLNLFLHITGQKQDGPQQGYHELQTVFALLDHGDTLNFAPADSLTLICPESIPANDDNLIIKAAKALQAHSGCTAGAAITLDKQLPMGGGVGGGSSDAATALLGLNHLWQLNLSLDELAKIGAKLGADVPVFVHGNSAWAEGIGEHLTPISLPTKHYLVIFPGIHVSTAQIFGDQQLTRDTPKSRLAAFLEPDSETCFRNDCEAVVTHHFPAVGDALNWLKNHAGNARMTGTGACVYAEIDSREAGKALIAQLPPRWTGFVACSVNRSPTLVALDSLKHRMTE